MTRRQFFVTSSVLALAAIIGGCLGSKSGLTVELSPETKQKGLELVDWGKSDNTIKIKIRNNSEKRLPGPNETWFAKRYDKQGKSMGRADRFMSGNLKPGETNTFEFEVNSIDKVGKIILTVADGRSQI